MPAGFLRESGQKIGAAFEQFSNSAQRIGVYTANDYVEIMQKLIDKWEIDKVTKPHRRSRKSTRLPYAIACKDGESFRTAHGIPEDSFIFKWVQPATIGNFK